MVKEVIGQKEEKKEKEKEEKEEKKGEKKKENCCGRMDGRDGIEGSTRGPCRPKKKVYDHRPPIPPPICLAII